MGCSGSAARGTTDPLQVIIDSHPDAAQRTAASQHHVPKGDPSPEAAYCFHNITDVLTGGIIRDPVYAKDGNLYERTSILAWFAACKQSRIYKGQVVSPLTLKPMAETLKDNVEMLTDLERRKDKLERGEVMLGLPAETPYKSIAMLSELFDLLDQLGAYLNENVFDSGEDAINPPVVIALGNESSGKSSILERLTMIPLLPRGDDTCTVCRRVHSSDLCCCIDISLCPILCAPTAASNHAPLASPYKS